jgi:hypothetical protein
MKYKTTAKEIRSGYYTIISAGYCSLQNLLKDENPVAYASGVYGWNFDVYAINGVAIATGYRGMPSQNDRGDYKLAREYDDKAGKIEGWDAPAQATRRALLLEFIEKARIK